MSEIADQDPDLDALRLALEVARKDLKEGLRVHIRKGASSDAVALRLAREYVSVEKPFFPGPPTPLPTLYI